MNCVLKGFGDIETWGTIRGTSDPRHEDNSAEIENRSAQILNSYLENWQAISEASASLTDEEYAAIDRAHAERDAMKLFKARDEAVRRVLTRWAHETAIEELSKQAADA